MMFADGSDTGDGRRGLLQEGSWDAIHVIEARMDAIVFVHILQTILFKLIPRY